MKYRIKITTFYNGREELRPYVKVWGLWFGIDYDGKQDLTFSAVCGNRNQALEKIDKHNEGNCKKKSIDFEYITKVQPCI